MWWDYQVGACSPEIATVHIFLTEAPDWLREREFGHILRAERVKVCELNRQDESDAAGCDLKENDMNKITRWTETKQSSITDHWSSSPEFLKVFLEITNHHDAAHSEPYQRWRFLTISASPDMILTCFWKIYACQIFHECEINTFCSFCFRNETKLLYLSEIFSWCAMILSAFSSRHVKHVARWKPQTRCNKMTQHERFKNMKKMLKT